MAKDWYKKKKSESLDAQMEKGYTPGVAADQETAAMYREALDAMDDLEEKDKEVLFLRYVEGLPPQDIAEALEETSNVISVRINRATKRLQQQLGYE